MYLLYLLILLIPFQNHPILGKNIFGTFTLIKLVGVFSLLIAVSYRLSDTKQGQGLLKSKIGKNFCGYTLFSFISFFVFYDPGVPHFKHLILLSMFTFFIVVLTFVDSEDKWRKCLWMCVLAMVLASVSLLKQCVQYGGRPDGSFGDPNIAAANAILVFPLAYYLFVSEKRYKYKMALLGMTTILIGGVLAAQSRGAMAALLVILLMMCWHSSKKIKAFFCVMLLLVVLIPFVPDSFWERLGMSGSEQNYGAKISTESHKARWLAGWNMLKEHPVLGVGMDNFYYNAPLYNPALEGLRGGEAHNMYIEIAAELGVTGFSIFASMLFSTFLILRRVKKIAKTNSDLVLTNLTKGFEVGLAGFLICGFFVNTQNQKLFWLVIFFVIILEKICSAKYSDSSSLKPYNHLVSIKNKKSILQD